MTQTAEAQTPGAQAGARAPDGSGAVQGLADVVLRGDDVERAIWFMDDLAFAFGQIAAGDANKHAKAAWLVLEENYRAAAQTLERLQRDRRILLTDLAAGEDATVRDSVVLIDETLDGAWPAERLARARQVGGDDWELISRLSSALLQQLGSFRSLDDWAWFKRHLRQSGSLRGAGATLEPALAAELIRFAHIKDKYLLAAIRRESAGSRWLATLWRERESALAGEAEDFVLRHAASFSPSSAAAFARAWREYAESAGQAATAYASVVISAPPADAGRDAALASEAGAAATRPNTLWPKLGKLIDAVPERIKSRATVAAEAAQSAASETAVPETTAAETAAIPAAEPAVIPEPAVPEPAVTAPAVSEPVTPGPIVADSGTPQPAPTESVQPEPALAESAAAPTISAPAVVEAEPAAPAPEVAATPPVPDAAADEPATVEPTATAPGASDRLALSELVQRAVEEEQTQQWREALNRETFQANGVTVPIRDEIAIPGSLPLSALESTIEPAAGGQQQPASVTDGAPTEDVPAEDAPVIRLQPLQPAADTAPSAGQVRPGLEWLQTLVERHRDAIALLPVAVLLALIVLVAVWLWRTARGRSEEPLILTTALEDDPYAEAAVAAAHTARPGATPYRTPYQEPIHQGATASGAGRPDPKRANAGAPAAARARDESHGSDKAHGSDRVAARAADPYAQARSELERGRPSVQASSSQTSTGPSPTIESEQSKQRRSSAIAVVQAAVKQHGEAPATPVKQARDAEQELGPQHLITALRSGDARQFEALLEQQTGLSRRDVRELLRKAKPDELAIACRGIGLDQLAFASMVIMIRRRYLGEAEVPPHQLSSALAAFISTSPDEARSRLQSWSLDAEFTPVEEVRSQGPAAGYSY